MAGGSIFGGSLDTKGMRPFPPDGMRDPMDSGAEAREDQSEFSAPLIDGEGDDRTLEQLRRRLEHRLSTEGLDDVCFDALHEGIEAYAPDTVRASLDAFHSKRV